MLDKPILYTLFDVFENGSARDKDISSRMLAEYYKLFYNICINDEQASNLSFYSASAMCQQVDKSIVEYMDRFLYSIDVAFNDLRLFYLCDGAISISMLGDIVRCLRTTSSNERYIAAYCVCYYLYHQYAYIGDVYGSLHDSLKMCFQNNQFTFTDKLYNMCSTMIRFFMLNRNLIQVCSLDMFIIELLRDVVADTISEFY